MDYLVANKYRIGHLIGIRPNTEIFLGIDTDTNEEVLIKRVNVNSKRPRLRFEYKIIQILTHRNGVGFPNIRAFRVEGDYNFLVTSLLGPSLEELFVVCNKKFTLKTVLMLAFQMISRVEFIHAHSFVHRDINPDNFLMGLGEDENRVYASGFGLSKPYRDFNFSPIRFRGYKHFVGTENYASIHTLSGIEQSRRDDLESLGYVLMYFLRGSLPWQEIKAENKRKRQKKICEMKALCEGYPPEFASYFHYCRSLQFDDKPDYLHLKRIFRGLFIREGGVAKEQRWGQYWSG